MTTLETAVISSLLYLFCGRKQLVSFALFLSSLELRMPLMASWSLLYFHVRAELFCVECYETPLQTRVSCVPLFSFRLHTILARSWVSTWTRSYHHWNLGHTCSVFQFFKVRDEMQCQILSRPPVSLSNPLARFSLLLFPCPFSERVRPFSPLFPALLCWAILCKSGWL